MRREFIQVIAVFALALGAGMFAFGRHLAPPFDATNPGAIQNSMSTDDDDHHIASVACGFGVCFMTFGALCLVLPWVNAALARRPDTGGFPTE